MIDLRHGALEEHGGEIGNPADVAQRLQDRSSGFPATRRAAIMQMSAGLPRNAVGSGLRGDGLGEWKCHVSPAESPGHLLTA